MKSSVLISSLKIANLRWSGLITLYILSVILAGAPVRSANIPVTWGANPTDFSPPYGSNVPLAIDSTGVLAGKTITTIKGGVGHTLMLTSDGKVYGWGANYDGQLGIGTNNLSTVPVAVNTSGVLVGKTIIAIACGDRHSLALDSNGKVYTWGYNRYGQLGNGTENLEYPYGSNLPVAVDTSGVLAGKTVTAIAGGENFSLALTSDGKVYAWGFNPRGELGIGTTNPGYPSVGSNVPIAVNTSGVLAAKTITAIAAGRFHSLALDSAGKAYAWGRNESGQLGDGSTCTPFPCDSTVPVAVDTSGVLAGKTVTAIAGGNRHSLFLTSDGKVYASGYDYHGELGNGAPNSTSPYASYVPVAVDTSGVLAGKTVTAIAAGSFHSLALASNGKVYSWGFNQYGQLGNGTANTGPPYASYVPVAVDTSGMLAGKIVTSIAVGYDTSLALARDSSSCPTITLAPSTLLKGTVGVAYSKTITASGGAAPYTFKVAAGTLPAGLTLSSAGLLSGTPTTASKLTFTVRATDANGCIKQKYYTLHICPVITLSPTRRILPAGQVGVAYSKTITASGGMAPYTFKIASGALPGGLTLSSAGVLSGTPTAAGDFAFTVQARDASGCRGFKGYTLRIGP